MQNEVFEYEVEIKEHHLDSFGHVNNSVYVKLFEEARWDFITKGGFGLEKILEMQKGPVILDLKVKFRRELKNRERVKIYSTVIEASRLIVLQQTIKKTDGKISAEAVFTVGYFDMKERKLLEPSPEWLKSLGIR